jgi:hypothetical protein
MPVRENIYKIEDAPTWIGSAAAVSGLVWCVQNGAIVAGSDTIPSIIPVPQTGNFFVDLSDFLSAWFLDATGDASPGTPIIDPPAVFVDGWGVVGLQGEGPGGQQPGVYIWAGVEYDFGTLNIPPQMAEADARDWFVKFTADVTAAEAVPAWPLIVDYVNTHSANPILHVAELKSIE